MRTETKLDAQARKAILQGVNSVYEPVRRTLGPAGGNGLLFRTFGRGPRITNDGVTIAEVIRPKDPFVRIASDAFKEACKRTNEKAGDGTTTTAVIGGKLYNTVYALLDKGPKYITASNATHSPMKIRNELLLTLDKVLKLIEKKSKKVKDLETLTKIATVSVEDIELGKMVANMVWEIGKDGHVDVIEGFKGEIETEIDQSMRFPAKVPATIFLNNPARYEMVAEDCAVLVTNYVLDNVVEVGSMINRLGQNGMRKLIILAPKFSEKVLVEIVGANQAKVGYQIFPATTPALRTEQYEDVASYMGATFINKDDGKKIQNVMNSDLGFVEKFIAKNVEAREDAVAIKGKGSKTNAVTDRIETLKGQIKETRVDAHKKLLQRRIASLASAIGVIKVGAPSQAEGLYKKLKIEDAVYACKAALEEGYVAGGGICLKEIADELGENILCEALRAPYNQIQENAEETLKIGDEVIDPVKSTRLAVEHAISVVAHLITVKIIVPEIEDETPADGYNAIARAIMTYAQLFAKREGLIKDGEEEAAREQLAKYEEDVINDNG